MWIFGWKQAGRSGVHSARFHLNFCVFYGSTRKSASLVSRGGFASVSGEIRPQIISGNHVLVGSQSAAQALVFLFNAGSIKLVANRLVLGQLFGCRRQLSCEIGYGLLQFCNQLVCGGFACQEDCGELQAALLHALPYVFHLQGSRLPARRSTDLSGMRR